MNVAAYSVREAERLAVLKHYDVLDTPPEEAFDRIVRLAATLAATPVAAISLADRGRHWFKAAIGLAVPQIPATLSFHVGTVADEGIQVVEDAHRDARFSDNPLASAPDNLRFFAGVPLRAPSGHWLGALWVMDRHPRGLDAATASRLADLAMLVIEVLELRAARNTLAASEACAQAERHKTSMLIHAMVEDSQDPIFVKDLDGRYLLVNSAAAQAIGHPADAILGQTDLDVLPPDVVSVLRATDLKVASSGQCVTLEELLPGPDGPKTYLSTKLPLLDTHGLLTGVFGIARDITARKRIERALLKAKEDACQASQAKSEFLRAMSHELRNPLNAVIGFSQILDLGGRDPLTPAQKTCVGHIQRAGQHLLELVNDILDLAKIESGQFTLTIRAVDVRHLLRETLPLVQHTAKSNAVTIRFEELPVAAPMVRADSLRLTQVLFNLLSNAIKYNRPGGQVTVTESLATNHRLRLTVTDTGPGLSLEHVGRLFRPFDRLGAESRGIEGSGIGLVITRRLLEMMDGEIGVTCPPGKGCAFWIELPQVDEASKPTASGPDLDRITQPVGYPADPTQARAMPARFAGDRP